MNNNNEKISRKDIKRMRENPAASDNRRCYWNKDDEKKLFDYFDEGVGISEIAFLMGRTERSIFKKLSKENKFVQTNRCFIRNQSDYCLCRKCKNYGNCEMTVKNSECEKK